MNTKNRKTPTPQSLHRKRRLLIAGIVTVLPAAAIMPSLIAPSEAPTPLLAVDEMTVATASNALVNEQAVRHTVAQRPVSQRESSLNATPDETHSSASTADAEIRWFNGRPVRPVRTIAMTVTAYSPDEQSCGESADGITASGYSVWTNGMKMVAADTDLLPFGTLVSVPGYDDAAIVPVLDRGGAIKGKRLDVLYPTHDRAMEWGVQDLSVTVWEYADGQPGDFQIAAR